MFMKWMLRLAFPALGVLLMLIFFGISDPISTASGPQRTPLETDDIPSFEGLIPSPVVTEGPDIVFKWRDRDGSWHYADTPPEEGPWNALAIERRESHGRLADDSDTPWHAPYRSPYPDNTRHLNHGS